jgi:hypothetical protein
MQEALFPILRTSSPYGAIVTFTVGYKNSAESGRGSSTFRGNVNTSIFRFKE